MKLLLQISIFKYVYKSGKHFFLKPWHMIKKTPANFYVKCKQQEQIQVFLLSERRVFFVKTSISRRDVK